MTKKDQVNYMSLDYKRYKDLESYEKNLYEVSERLELDRKADTIVTKKEQVDSSTIEEKTYNPANIEALFYVLDQEDLDDIKKYDIKVEDTKLGILRYKLELRSEDRQISIEGNFSKSGLPEFYEKLIEVYDQLAQL